MANPQRGKMRQNAAKRDTQASPGQARIVEMLESSVWPISAVNLPKTRAYAHKLTPYKNRTNFCTRKSAPLEVTAEPTLKFVKNLFSSKNATAGRGFMQNSPLMAQRAYNA